MRALSAIGLFLLSGIIPVLAPPTAASPHDFNFLPRVEYSTGATPYHVALGDLNEDGWLDIVTANRGTGSVTVRYNDGTGGFTSSADFATDTGPRWSELADLNGDGHLDLVTANYLTPTLTVRLGNGTGGFGTVTSCGTTYPATSVAVADFNRDGRLDLVATVANSSEGILEFFPGLGTGAFGTRKDLVVGKLPYAVVAADFNGDSKPDVAIADHGVARIWISLGNGTSTPFSSAQGYTTPAVPWCVAAADLDHDGDVDLASANDSSPTSSILLNIGGSGVFTNGALVPVGAYPYSVAIGDVNGDGNMDLVTTSDGNGLTLSAGNGNGTFTPAGTLSSPGASVSVALGDLSGHGALDIAVVALNISKLSVFLQVTGTDSTATVLGVSPDASIYGQPVDLTARLWPDSAQGPVEFVDGDVTLGYSPVVAGFARFTATGLVHGEHVFSAWYKGSEVFAPSRSDDVVHRVALAKSKIVISPSADPTLVTIPFWALATVSSPSVPGEHPKGSVQFRIDGVPMGLPVELVSGVATSPSTTDLGLDAHMLTAVFLPADTLRFAPTADSVKFVVESGFPAIAAVKDVPHDQGGKVFLTWRCRLDTLASRPITRFRVWRRVPSPAARDEAGPAASAVRFVGLAGESFWEPVAEIPSASLGSYGFTASTTQDSLAESNTYSVFFVQALTRDPDLWYVSGPDSGYSVDNLSPRAPAAFTARYGSESVELHWSASPEADFLEYRLFRGGSTTFDLDAAHLVLAGPDTGYVDVSPGTSRVYKLVAVDVHGNASRVATVTPDQNVSVLAAFVDAQATASRIDLRWYTAGGAGLPVAVYRRTLDTPWELMGHATADRDGFVAYSDEAILAGVRYGYRLGIEDGDHESFVGAAWVTAEDVLMPFVAVQPNPITSGAVHVRFALPTGTTARLELWDIAGRRVAQQELKASGAGPASVVLEGTEGLRAGVYLLRCSGGPIRSTQRVVMIR